MKGKLFVILVRKSSNIVRYQETCSKNTVYNSPAKNKSKCLGEKYSYTFMSIYDSRLKSDTSNDAREEEGCVQQCCTSK